MKRLFFAANLLLYSLVFAQKIPKKPTYQITSLKIQEVDIRKDTVYILTLSGLKADEVFTFVKANQGRLEGIGQVEVINKKDKLRDYYSVNIWLRKVSEVPKLPFQGSFYIGYNTNQYKFRFNYAKHFGISGIVAADFMRPEDGTTLRFAPAFTSDFSPFLLPNIRGSIDVGPMFGSQIRFATLMARTTVERNINDKLSFGFSYMLIASRKRLSEWGAGISYHF